MTLVVLSIFLTLAGTDQVNIGWQRPSDPLELTVVSQYPDPCPPEPDAIALDRLPVFASGEQQARFWQGEGTGCYCYRIVQWSSERGTRQVVDHEHCSATQGSCH